MDTTGLILMTSLLAVLFLAIFSIDQLELKINVWGAMLFSWLMSLSLGLTVFCIIRFAQGEAVSRSDVSIGFWVYFALTLLYCVEFYFFFNLKKKEDLKEEEKKKKEAEAKSN
jgi:Na+-transporting NADH:ubiquinone oxidoreductase subunit NqrB